MPNPVTVLSANLNSATLPLRQPWQWCVGSGHATLALRADWQAQLAQAHKDLGFRHVRFHGLLDDDMGTLICQNDQPLYSFFNTDQIFDFLLSIGMKPVVELSFMPRMLSSGGDIVFRYQGNITPPKDPAQWAELVRRLVAHWVERYGIDEVAQWPLECWNEPNLKAFWTGDQASYFDFYRTTAVAIKSVDARLQVGGPATAGNAWLDDFTAYCRSSATPLDFVSTHYYPTDPFGAIDTDTITQLEHSPPLVMRTRAQEARASVGALPLYYTEWSISSNPRDSFHDSSFAAALAVRIAMNVDDVVDGYSYWTFSDIFEENYFPSVPYHGGFGMMNLYGIPKPIYRALQMLRTLGSEHFEVSGAQGNLYAWASPGEASGDAASGCATHIVLMNQAMPRHPIGNESLLLRLTPRAGHTLQTVTLRRVDEAHANPAQAWQAMGSPDSLKPAQVDALMQASMPQPEPLTHRLVDGMVEIALCIAPQSVNHLQLDWSPVT
ncbi:xylan 1,4-beta-xylosidase [Polaromonas sp. CG_9.5]|uniref:GH39 family glycosyl hydrolase n=1 Tax=Polaromonas sp. CG_9.5 TaxID=3071705 RepID=UPI002DF97675|nr:xylan 1,4-beta-xylosidase [Polaromonas sp. CG_9.5]